MSSTADSRPGCTPSTLVGLLRERALRQPDQKAFAFLLDGEEEAGALTYAELDRRARAIAGWLGAGAAAGERAMLLYPSGLDFVAAFFGCLYAGMTAVPAYSLDAARLARTVARLAIIAADCRPSVALTDGASLAMIERLIPEHPALANLRWVDTASIGDGASEGWRQAVEEPEAAAVIQYTSGSTKAPRGVMLSHANILANQEAFRSTFDYSSANTFVGWVPLAHDLGLFAHVVLPVYVGAVSVLMTPEAFIQTPARWMKAVGRYPQAATHAPNFAWELAARRTSSEDLAALDLSGLHTADLGGEPIRMQTLDRFAEVFTPCGFRRERFVAAYGLAEGTLVVSSARNPRGLKVVAAELERDQVVDASDEGPARMLVSVGAATPDQRVAIVDPVTLAECEQDRVGEIWVAGPNVGMGYWEKPEDTRATFEARIAGSGEGPFLRTGDLGFVRDGEIFVTGRLKDVIVLKGRNYYPQDFEFTVERCDKALRPGCTAAFAVETGEEERLVILQELRDAQQAGLAEILSRIRSAVFQEHGVTPHAVVLLSAGGVHKTSSGKVQRQACRAAYLAGSLKAIGESIDEAAKVGPRTAIERRLTELWAEALDLDAAELGVHDSFFDLGGDSLAATHCAGLIGAAFGRTLAPELFLFAPTIAGMAEELGSVIGRRTEVVTIRRGGSGVPLIVVAPGLEARGLARHLPAEHPVLGIRVADLGQRPELESMEQIAAEYTEALLQARPEGPYALCGWCSAGVAALEMARCLENAGKEVAFVALFDAREVRFPEMGKSRRALVKSWRFMQRSGFLGARMRRMGWQPFQLAVRQRVREWARFRGRMRERVPANHADRLIQALADWKGRPWAGRVLHIWAAERPTGRYRDLGFEWGELTPGQRYFEVPGDHLSMLHEPHVEAVVQVLAGELGGLDV